MQPVINVFTKTFRRKLYTNAKLSVIAQNKIHNIQSTIDTDDVKFHSKLFDEWWDIQGKMRGLHSFNNIRVPFVRDGLVQESQNNLSLKGVKILDVGCGGGILSEGLAATGANVTGIDASKELIEMAKAHSELNIKLAENKPTYYRTSAEEHAQTHPEYYDGVVASEVIEHVNNKELFVKSCVQMLKPGGRIFFTTPNKTRLSQFVIIFLSENLFKNIPKGTHQYEKFIELDKLKSLLEKNNCRVEMAMGNSYNPILNSWKTISSPSMIFSMRAVKMF